jgi:hypothetical protein
MFSMIPSLETAISPRFPMCWRTLLFFRKALTLALLGAVCMLPGQLARGDDMTIYAIVLKDHKFDPAEIHVPSGKPFVVDVTNSDGDADEFEMLLPAIERSLQPGQEAKLRIRPLGPGHFPFFGESDPDSEHGVFVSE